MNDLEEDVESTSVDSSVTSSDSASSSDSGYDDDDDDDDDPSSFGQSHGLSRLVTKYIDKGEIISNCRRQKAIAIEDTCIEKTLDWTKRVPVGMGLCPWAVKSLRSDRIRFVNCILQSEPSQIVATLLEEAKSLMSIDDDASCCIDDDEGSDHHHAFFTTLLIIPNVVEWNSCVHVFDTFVRKLSLGCYSNNNNPDNGLDENIADTHHDNNNESSNAAFSQLQEDFTLVAFHPQFLRWRGLPEGVGVGSPVHAYKSVPGLFQKSSKAFPATILETNSRMFGRRRVKVQFQTQQQPQQSDDLGRAVVDADKASSNDCQYVPVNWCIFGDGSSTKNLQQQSVAEGKSNSAGRSSHNPLSTSFGPPLPDNAMHRSPFPTIHLIRNQDLAQLRARDVSRVKRKNAQRMGQAV